MRVIIRWEPSGSRNMIGMGVMGRFWRPGNPKATPRVRERLRLRHPRKETIVIKKVLVVVGAVGALALSAVAPALADTPAPAHAARTGIDVSACVPILDAGQWDAGIACERAVYWAYWHPITPIVVAPPSPVVVVPVAPPPLISARIG